MPKRRSNRQPNPAPRYVTLAATEAILDSADQSRKLPERFRVFPWGTVETDQGPITLDASSAASIRRRNRTETGDTVVLDFEHNTVKGHENYMPEPCPVAAHCRIEIVPDDGLYFVPTDWTDDGEKYVGGKHYKDVSLAAKLDSTGHIRRVLSAGACREGEVEEMCLLSRTSDDGADDFPEDNPETKTTMDNEKLVAAIREALELDADVTPEGVLEALIKRLADAGVEVKKEDVETAALSIDLNDEGQIIALKKALGLDELITNVTDFKKSSETDLRDRLLSRAASEGKVVPKSAQSYKPDVLEALIDELPVTVPLSERGGDVTLSRRLDESNGYDSEMGKALGISKETFEANAD